MGIIMHGVEGFFCNIETFRAATFDLWNLLSQSIVTVTHILTYFYSWRKLLSNFTHNGYYTLILVSDKACNNTPYKALMPGSGLSTGKSVWSY